MTHELARIALGLVLILASSLATACRVPEDGEDEVFYEEYPAWGMPDLAIEGASIDPKRAEPGERVRLTATVTNRGPGDAPAARLEIRMRGERVASAAVEPLASSHSTLVEAEWVVGEPGVLPLSAVLEPGAGAMERTLGNNSSYLRLRVKGAVEAPPELEIAWEGLEMLQIDAGDPIAPRLIVRNVGLAATPPASIVVHHDGEVVSEVSLPALEPDAVQSVQVPELRVHEDGNLFGAWVDWPDGVHAAAPRSWSRFIQVAAETLAASEDVKDQWRSIGPRLIKPKDWTGRMTCFAFHPTEAKTIYAGGAGHQQNGPGLWKSTDGGKRWMPLTDRLETMSVGSIAIDPQRSQHVYFGSGFNRPRGLWKSPDGGAKWHKYATRAALGNAMNVTRLIFVDAEDGSQLLYVATDVGVFRHAIADPTATKTSPAQWKLIKSGNVIGMEVSPGDPEVLFASLYGDGLYRTASASTASGDSDWKRLSKGLPPATAKQFLHFDVHRTRPKLLYMALYVPTASDLLGIYRSDDGGDSWSEVKLFATKADLPKLPDYPNNHPYNPFLRLSGGDPPYIYFGGVILFRAREGSGGLDVTTVPGAFYDLKGLEFDPNNPTRYFVVGDQGVFEGQVAATADVVTPRQNELRVTQFFDLDVSQVTRGMVLGGTQDTGTMATAPTLHPPDWKLVRFGDGNHSLILPPNSQGTEIFFSQTQYFDSTKWTDEGTSIDAWTGNWKDATAGLPTDQYYVDLGRAWITKHPGNPNRVFAQGDSAHALTAPFGQNQWKAIGPSGTAVKGTVHRVVVQPGGNTVAAGTTDPGQIWTSSSGGGAGSWDLAFERGWDPAGVQSMAFSAANPRVLFILYPGGGRKDMRVVRLELPPESSSWNVTGYMGAGLPDVANLNAISGDGYDPDIAYVATDTGVFRCDNTKPLGQSCQPYNQGFPLTVVFDLLVDPTTRELVAGTLARGAWRVTTRPTEAADLLPLKRRPESSPLAYCDRTGGKLRVRVKNQGSEQGIGHVLVEFGHSGTGFVNLGMIQPGQEANGSVSIPGPIPVGSFDFEIHILPMQRETDLDNNVAAGRCVT